MPTTSHPEIRYRRLLETAKTDVLRMRPNMAPAQSDTGFVDIHLSTVAKIEDAKITFHWQENTAPPVVPATYLAGFRRATDDPYLPQRLICSTDAFLPMVIARNQQRVTCTRSDYPQSFNCSARTKLKIGGSGNSVPRSCVVRE
jgi:hypothetical protein